MLRTILEAMHSLGQAGLTFGVDKPKEGELRFKLALGEQLRKMTSADGWSWNFETEERFATGTLTNGSAIEIDIVGRHQDERMVAIELKYVPVKGVKPSDRYAFPYDVAKDCLRLDLLRAGYCRPASTSIAQPVPAKLQTFAIAMTNYPVFWEGRAKFGWSTKFLTAMTRPPVVFEGLMETTGHNAKKTIFKNARCHVAFGQPWAGAWEPYSSTAAANAFSYLLLRPVDDRAVPDWQYVRGRSVSDASAIIPFLACEHHAEWKRQHDALWSEHVSQRCVRASTR